VWKFLQAVWRWICKWILDIPPDPNRIRVVMHCRDDYAAGRNWDGFGSLENWYAAFCEEIKSLGFTYWRNVGGGRSDRYADYSNVTGIYYLTFSDQSEFRSGNSLAETSGLWTAKIIRLVNSTSAFVQLIFGTIGVGEIFSNGAASATTLSVAERNLGGSVPWSGTASTTLQAARTHGLKVYLFTTEFECGYYAPWGMHFWHDWNSTTNYTSGQGSSPWTSAQHQDEMFVDECLAYGDAFAGFVSSEVWRWYQGMADFYGGLQAYAPGTRLLVPVTTGSITWWFTTEFAETPKATSGLEVYWKNSDEDYRSYIDRAVAGPLWDELQSLWHQCFSGAGQITYERLVYAHTKGFRGEYCLYDDTGSSFWDLDVLAATQSFKQARTPLLVMLSLFNQNYGSP